MSRCGNCGTSTGGCTCEFVSNETAVVTGNGQSYAAINYRPTNVPLPRPYGQLSRRDSDQTVLAGATTAVVFDTEFDVFAGGMTNVALTPTRLTAPETGYYLVSGFLNTINVDSYISLRKNGVPIANQILSLNGGGSVVSLINMNVGDYLELYLTAGATNVTINRSQIGVFTFTDLCYPHLWAEWVRPL